MSTNPWIIHVKKYAKDNNMSYGCAISKAKETYVRPQGSKPIKSKAKKPVEIKEEPVEIKEEPVEIKEEKPDYTDFIVDNWESPKIGEIIKGFDPDLYNEFDRVIIDEISRGVELTSDWFFLPLTKKYNDKVILKYGGVRWIDGFHNILDYMNKGMLKIVDTVGTPEFQIPDEAVNRAYLQQEINKRA